MIKYLHTKKGLYMSDMSAIEPYVQSAKENETALLAAHLKTFEFEGNYAKLYFDTSAGTDKEIQTGLHQIGITEVLHKHTDMSGAYASGHAFILDYANSKQKSAIDALHYKFVRMSALKALFANGGFQLSKDEQLYFDKEAARIAAIKVSGNAK